MKLRTLILLVVPSGTGLEGFFYVIKEAKRC